ncbi:MAG: polymorphic membrane protein [Lentisphaerae bacterium ADurb.BinA184]|nr:MAG: polymorphic membrane protein [Lentisphaerae bacterium ADurb.BinA184]
MTWNHVLDSLRRTALVVAIVAGVSASTAPLTYYVDVTAPAGGGGGMADPFNSITAAVSALNLNAAVGQNEGTLAIADGTYSIAGETFGANGIEITKYMTIKGGYAGSGDWSEAGRVPRSSVIDLNGANTRAFYQNTPSHWTMGSTFDGLTFQNANHTLAGGAIGGAGGWAVGMSINDCLFQNNTTTASGGAVYLAGTAAGTLLRNSDFVNNHADAQGGALCWTPSYAFTHLVENCTFEGNAAGTGGAIHVTTGANSDATARIEGCVFEGNTATANGGALFSPDGAGNDPIAVRQSRFTGNSAPRGAAIGGADYWHGEYYLENCLVAGNLGGYAITASGYRVLNDYAVDIVHSTIVDNPGGGISVTYNGEASDLGVRVRDSIVANNGAVGVHFNRNGGTGTAVLEYNDVWGQASNYLGDAAAGAGAMSVDPGFKASGGEAYTLGTSSPLIDAGTNLGIAVDLLGLARPDGAGYAMGAFEVPVPEPSALTLLAAAGLAAFVRRRQA